LLWKTPSSKKACFKKSSGTAEIPRKGSF